MGTDRMKAAYEHTLKNGHPFYLYRNSSLLLY